jgi:phosphoglycolate phosphatase-like HAD superfamily hydrolase
MLSKKNSLPLAREKWLAIFDRDATIISSREIAYACYGEAFDRVVSKFHPSSTKLNQDDYAREYNQLDRMRVYRKYYPALKEEELEEVARVSWQYYLAHYDEKRHNLLIPGMRTFLKKFKANGNMIVILTSSDEDGKWMRYHGLPVDGLFSLVRLKKEWKEGCDKKAVIHHILKQFKQPAGDAVTIGDHPQDHIDDLLSIGVGFGLGCAQAREELRGRVKIYAASVRELSAIFGV